MTDQRYFDIIAELQDKVEVFSDAKTERAMMSLRITAEEYRQLANEVINDWEFGEIPDRDWDFFHLLNAIRVKQRIIKDEQRNSNNRNGNTSRQDTINAAAQAIAALAAKGQHPVEPPF